MSTQTTQPVIAYPNSMTVQQPPPPPSSHSNGSFGAVFIVLAVIVVVSGIACFLGRFCNRKSVVQAKAHGDKHHHDKKPKSKPKERERDIEFGFEPSKRITAVRPLSSEPRGFRVHKNGEQEPTADIAGEQLKAGA